MLGYSMVKNVAIQVEGGVDTNREIGVYSLNG